MQEVKQPEKPKASRFDRLIGFFSPRLAARREADRKLLDFVRSDRFSIHRAAETSRLTGNNWLGSKLSHDSALEEDLESMRDRSRELYRSNATTAGFVDGRVAKVIGCGLRPQGRIKLKRGFANQARCDEWNEQLENVFLQWSPHADFNGVLSFPEILRQVERNWTIDGDVFGRFRARAGVDKPIALALEVIPADRVATPVGMEGDADVRLGIRYDASGRRVGYYVLTEAPNDTLRWSQDYEYVPIVPDDSETGLPQIVHLYEQLFPGQSRGIPAVSPVLSDIRDEQDLKEAVVIREQVKACFSVFIKNVSDPYGTAVSAASDTTSGGLRIENMSPGRIERLGAGQDITTADPGSGGSEYGPFMEWNRLDISAALNWPYSWLTKDYRKSTYSSERMALIDGSNVVKCRQQLHILRLLLPFWGHLCDQAMITGELECDPDAYWLNRHQMQAHVWIPPGIPWIDPMKDVQASKIAVEENFRTRASIIAENGDDPEEVQSTRSAEKEWDKQWGITPADQQPEPTPEPAESAA